MNRLISMTLILLLASAAQAEEIPLKSIWARYMPGTQNVRELSPELSDDLAVWLMRQSTKGRNAGKCFLVPGEGKAALQGAVDVLMGGEKRPTKLAGQEASLVFYSYSAPGVVTIYSIEREKQEITVRFKVTTHDEALSTTHFALIPLGKLPAGKFEVEIVEIEPDTPYRNKERTQSAVCKSCTIEVEEGVKK